MKYDKNKCKSKMLDGLFKGYSGCMCSYCSKFKRTPSPWIVVCHGNHKNYELSIVRTNNRHGRESWGWDEPNQKIIFSKGKVPKEAFDILLEAAENTAKRLNAKEKIK